ncbi:MAG: hypothetical protein JXA73_00205 [Acidobacteria bacterium]|nr:hypothetical protein [Acidobacteriota bacterium]
MSGRAGVVRIEAEFDENEAVSGINQLRGSIQSLPGTAQEAKSEFQKLWDEVARSRDVTDKATSATKDAAESIGNMASKGTLLTGVLTGLSTLALPAITLGIGLVVSKFIEWQQESEKAREENEKFNQSLIEQRRELANLRTEYDLMGMKGAARLEEIARRSMEVTKMRLDLLKGSLQALELGQKQSGRGLTKEDVSALKRTGFYFGPGVKLEEEIAATKELIETTTLEYEKYEQQLANAMKRGTQEYADAEEKKTAKTQKEYETRLKNLQIYLDATRKLEIASILDPASRIGAQRLEDLEKAGLSIPGVTSEAVAARQAAVNAKAVADLQKIWLQQTRSIKTTEPLEGTFDQFLSGLKAEGKSAEEFLKQGKEAMRAWEQEQDRIINLNEKMAQDAERNFERAANAIEGFFNRVFLTARSFSDVWRQLWMQMANFGISQIAKMVAAWWTGQRSMSQASYTGGYGGGGYGGVTQGVQSVLQYASAAPAMMGGAYGTADMLAGMSGISSSGYEGLGATGTGAISGGASMGANISSLLKSPAGLGIAGMVGLNFMNMGINRGNMALAGISGFMGGGFAGLALASSGLLGTGLLASAAFLGPVGALAGLGVGLFLAARKRGQQKTASTAVHAQYNELHQQIIEDFQQHKRGYDDAVSSLTSAYESSVMALQSMGTPGSRTISEISGYYREGLTQMKAIQARREGRLSTISGLPVPEFAGGSDGIIRSGSGNGFAAIIHPREAVLNERAAAALGDDAIRKLNAGKPAGGMDVHLHFPDVYDSRGFERVLTTNIDSLKKVIRRAAKDISAPMPV